MTDVGDSEPISRAAERTRNLILDAFLRLAHSSNAVTVSIPAVAEAAGVSIRTVYRYFPSKDELQNAAAYRFPDIALGDASVMDDISVDSFEQTLAKLWTTFAERIPALYAEHASPAGRKLRMERLPDSRARIARVTGGRLDDETVDLIVAVTSSSMFLELVDRMGYSAEQAASLGHRLVWLLLDDRMTDLHDPELPNPELKER